MVLRRRRFGAGIEGEVRELESALSRLGYSVPPGTTLLALEHTLARSAGPAAARYVRRLRERRFSQRAGHRPDPHARRTLRRALTHSAGLLGRLQGLLALPPGAGPARFRRT
jgi:hypothetical protein